MMYDEMLTLICQAIEICVLSTEEACCPFLISFLVYMDKDFQFSKDYIIPRKLLRKAHLAYSVEST